MKIAIAYDGSAHANRAVEVAVSMFQHVPDCTVVLLHVVSFEEVKTQRLMHPSKESIWLARQSIFQPMIHLIQQAGLTVQTVVLKGKPTASLLHYLQDNDVQHLFVGSRGLNTIQEFIIGSVSHHLLHHAHCPVTVVK